MGELPRILVVDDDPDIRRLLAASLGRIACVATASGVEEAMTQLAQQAPSVVVTDVMMPGGTGLELARRMRSDSRLCTVPIVILSARSSPRDLVDGINAGARHYVTKPFRSADLERKIAKLLATVSRPVASVPQPARAEELEIALDDVDLDELSPDDDAVAS